MSVNESPRNRIVGFLTSLPGILTGVGALITAVGGIYLGAHTIDSRSTSSPQPASASAPAPNSVVINLALPPGNVPDPGQVTDGSLRLANAPASASDLPDSGSNDSFDQLINSCAEGDDAACATILDMLVNDCAQGYGLSCDALYEISPSGSDFEAFGATCGGRFDPALADNCRYQ